MNERQRFLLTLSTLVIVCLVGAQFVQAQEEQVRYRQITGPSPGSGIAFDDPNFIPDPANFDAEIAVDAVPTHSGVTDFSASGLDLGTAGYWFFNFDQSANTGSAPEFGEVEALPSWVTVDKDPNSPAGTRTLSGDFVNTSSGGQGWETLTLPEASGPLTGESGATIAPLSNNDSQNIFQNMILGPGTPQQFLLHIVSDNTGGTHDLDKRLKFRGKEENGREINMRLNSLPTGGGTDVYTFIMENWGANDELRMQVRNASGAEFASITGIMFDVIPEPTSFVLLGLGAVGLGCIRRR